MMASIAKERRKVSKRTGVTLSDAVIGALEAKLKGTRRQVNRTKVDTLSAAIQDLPVIDGSTPEQILGSDDFGLPREKGWATGHR